MRRCWIVGTDGLGEADMAEHRHPGAGPVATTRRPAHVTHNRAERTAADPHAEQLAAAYRDHRLDL